MGSVSPSVDSASLVPDVSVSTPSFEDDSGNVPNELSCPFSAGRDCASVSDRVACEAFFLSIAVLILTKAVARSVSTVSEGRV